MLGPIMVMARLFGGEVVEVTGAPKVLVRINSI